MENKNISSNLGVDKVGAADVKKITSIFELSKEEMNKKLMDIDWRMLLVLSHNMCDSDIYWDIGTLAFKGFKEDIYRPKDLYYMVRGDDSEHFQDLEQLWEDFEKAIKWLDNLWTDKEDFDDDVEVIVHTIYDVLSFDWRDREDEFMLWGDIITYNSKCDWSWISSILVKIVEWNKKLEKRGQFTIVDEWTKNGEKYFIDLLTKEYKINND